MDPPPDLATQPLPSQPTPTSPHPPSSQPPASTPQTQSTHVPPPPPHPFSPSTCTLITQGAEALLYRTYFLTPDTPAALKVRPSKPYRHEVLDRRLTRQRVLAEARVLVKLSALRSDPESEVRVPAVLGVEWDVGRRIKSLDPEARGRTSIATDTPATTEGATSAKPTTHAGAWLLMEWIPGKSVKELLREWDVWYKNSNASDQEKTQAEEEVKKLLRRIGRAVGAMHSKGGVVHGDLTSSNIMIRPPFSTSTTTTTTPPPTDEAQLNGITDHESPSTKPDLSGPITLIDFGLATQSIQDEDRAVDLYVLERAFGSTHPRQEGWFDQEVLGEEGYKGSFGGSRVVLKRLEEVRLRGRKRSMVG